MARQRKQVKVVVCGRNACVWAGGGGHAKVQKNGHHHAAPAMLSHAKRLWVFGGVAWKKNQAEEAGAAGRWGRGKGGGGRRKNRGLQVVGR